MPKSSKSLKRRKRRKLSKLLTSMKEVKKRLPTCQGGWSFKSPKDYDRKTNKEIVKRELNDWKLRYLALFRIISSIYIFTHARIFI